LNIDDAAGMLDGTFTVADPIQELEHSHGEMSTLVLELAEVLRRARAGKGPGTATRRTFVARLETLRDELLQHFAREEEGLFPFVREELPDRRSAVDELEASHDTICGAVLRLSYIATHADEAFGAQLPTVLAVFERFQKAYAMHSQDELELFRGLGTSLSVERRSKLAELLRGL